MLNFGQKLPPKLSGQAPAAQPQRDESGPLRHGAPPLLRRRTLLRRMRKRWKRRRKRRRKRRKSIKAPTLWTRHLSVWDAPAYTKIAKFRRKLGKKSLLNY